MTNTARTDHVISRRISTRLAMPDHDSIPLRVLEDAAVPITRAVRKPDLTGACTDRPNPDVTSQNRFLSAPLKTHHADHERGVHKRPRLI